MTIGRRRRRALFVGSTATVAAAAIAFAGFAESDRGSGPAKSAARSTTGSQTKNLRSSTLSGTGVAAINPACPNWHYEILLNGQRISDDDAPLSLKAGRTVDLQIQPAPGQLAISEGTAHLIPAQTGARLTASDTTALINGTTSGAGVISYHLSLTTPAGGSLPAGTYNLVMPYTTPCAAMKTSGGEMDMTVNLG